MNLKELDEHKIFLGSSEVKKIYLGNQVVYPHSTEPYYGSYIKMNSSDIGFDLGYYAVGSDIVKMTWYMESNIGMYYLYGSGDGSNGEKSYRLPWISSTDELMSISLQYGQWGNSTIYQNISIDSLHKLLYIEVNPSLGKLILNIGEDTFEYPFTAKTFTNSTYTAWFLAVNDHGSIWRATMDARIYDFEIVGKVHLVPYKNPSTGQSGFHDTVRNIYYYKDSYTFVS